MAVRDLRVFHGSEFVAEALLEAKGDRVVSLCLPARDEGATVAAIVAGVRRELMERIPLVDEVLVVDDGSVDDTVSAATAAGAKVVGASDVLGECGPGQGKGEALWKALGTARGDLLAFCDADLHPFDPAFITGVLGPLLADPAIGFVKGFYDRPLEGVAGTGGRVTELVARPVLALLFPHLAGIVQPLAGEFAARREVLEQVPFVEDYGVDLGLLIDVSSRFGVDAVAQVDLGSRTHRNRPLDQLGPQAMAVLRTALDRAGVDVAAHGVPALVRPGREPLSLEARERPPMIEVAAYRRRARPRRPS